MGMNMIAYLDTFVIIGAELKGDGQTRRKCDSWPV